MRDVVQEILHGITGQTLILDAPEGRPTSVTSVSVFYADDDDDGPVRPATTGSASVETNPNTTTSANIAIGATGITLTSGTGVVATRAYQLADASGAWEWVELASINGTAAVSRVPLINAYTAGATFKSTRMSIAIDATWVADRGNLSSEEAVDPLYRVAWVYVVGGVTYRRLGHFDLVRYSQGHTVTPIDVDVRFPSWLDQLPIDYRSEQGRRMIDQAWRSVRMDLRADGVLGRWVRNADVTSELVICRANLCAIERSALVGGASPEQLKIANDIYRQRYDQIVREPHTTNAVAPMGGTLDPIRSPLWRR